MDKENGKSSEGGTGSSKLSNPTDPTALLDAASLFAYWPRGDANSANAASLFAASTAAAAGGSAPYGLPHPAMPFGMLPPTPGRGVPAFPPPTSSSPATAAAAAAAYNNAYTNTLSVAASQAASLGIPAASAAWWSMASHLAAQDYLARLQASGLSFPGLGNLSDPYAALGLPSLGSHHKSSKNSKSSSSSSLPKLQQGGSSVSSKEKLSNSVSNKPDVNRKSSSPMPNSKGSLSSTTSSQKYSSSMKLPASLVASTVSATSTTSSASNGEKKTKIDGYGKSPLEKPKNSPSPSSSIFTNPLSMASNDKVMANAPTPPPSTSSSALPSIPASILSDPNSILGGVRLPPDTEIIKYTSSIVGPKIPGTTNRGRKKTISLDPPSVSLHPSLSSTGMLIERTNKRPKMDHSEMVSPSSPNDRVEVIKLPTANGSPSGITTSTPFSSATTNNTSVESTPEGPLNLSLKPSTSTPSNHTSSSLNSLSNMSANIGIDRISRRKPGPKPRKVIQSPSVPSSSSASCLSQLFSAVEASRPPSRNDFLDSCSSSNTSPNLSNRGTELPMPSNHKDGRPRNLGRGVSKPKKNTVASLLAQSRALDFLGIKPMPILDPNAPMTQQMSLLKSNILAAQYIAESGGDEKTLNKFLQEKFRGTLSDSSTVDASTDSDNLTDSNQTDSEMEIETIAKKQKHYDERALRLPLERGWKRETVIRGVSKSGCVKGDVTYIAPDSNNKFKQMSDVSQYLDYQKSLDLSKENFTFSSRVIIGDYIQPMSSEHVSEADVLRLSEDEVLRRLDEIKSTMRTSLPVEQRIEVARRQQAARAAARLDREQARIQREIEKSERQEAARRDREAKSQQLLEAKRKRQEEIEKHKQEEQQRKQQERELKRQQNAILKEQMYIQEISKQREMLYTVELERERRRQHLALVKALESRRKLEERERKKQQILAEKQANKEKKLEQRRIEMEILTELRKPCEDLELDQKPLPEFTRIPGLKLPGKAFADVLMVFEFLHNFGETLGFDMESLPTLDSLQQALLYNDASNEAEEELLSVMTHLIVCAIEDPGIPNPARHTTILGQSLRQADITHANISEILRIYLYANATGEVKSLTGVHFERDREKRVADHHQNECEMQQTQAGKNATYYELLHENPTWKMSDLLKDKPFLSLSPTHKAAILAFLCNELLQNKAVIRQIEGSLETVAQCKKEKWLLDAKIRKLRMLHSRKVRTEAVEKAVHLKIDGESVEGPIDSPATTHKEDPIIMDHEDEENEMSENESVITQPEEEEDNKLSGEELGKKIEKIQKASEVQLQSLNSSAHQLRATCFGQDRYWRRYWSLPKAGGVFVEGMESAEPEFLEEVEKEDEIKASQDVKSLDDVNKILFQVEPINDKEVDKEVSNIVGNNNETKETIKDEVKEQEKDSLEDKENKMVQEKIIDDNDNEHRKVTNRLEVIENGEITDCTNHNLEELRKSVDRIVQSLDKEKEQKMESQPEQINQTIINVTDPIVTNVNEINHITESSIKVEVKSEPEIEQITKKFNLFEKLGECMERENKTEEDLKGDVKPEAKEDLKNEILNELKTDIKTEIKTEPDEDREHDKKWFSILPKDGQSCKGINLTAGNRWDNGVGACTRDNLTELKIPVFPPPSCSSTYISSNCDSPAPLQMTAEESAQLEYIKVHGLPKACERATIPKDKRFGWWRVLEVEQLKQVLDNLHVRGARERELKRSVLTIMQMMYEDPSKLHIEEGQKESTELTPADCEPVEMLEDLNTPAPDRLHAWSELVANRVDLFLLEQVEALEDKVANASMQVKGWRPPSREENDTPDDIVYVAKERLRSLEAAIERRYLKPPLGASSGDPNLAAIAQEAAGNPAPVQPPLPFDEVPKGLVVWREAIIRSQTSAQLAMCLYSLEASIAWDKSIMKAVSLPHVFNKQRARKYNSKLSNCQFCNSGDNEDKLLLCDSCDKGYHTYCFKPKMENIPDGDWYCHECMNKATGERNCIVCGKKQSSTGTRLILCEICPRAYHTDCIQPILYKVPRGKWYCINCISKKPQKKTMKRNKVARESESSDLQHPPSPAPSHSSVTTNEDNNLPIPCNQSDVSNSSLTNTGSPSTTQNVKKDKFTKKLLKELAPCKAILEDLECHDDAWPFLLPVNTKQFPTYKKIIKCPMDLSTIKKRLQDLYYKSRDEFCMDVRQIFNNCETFNEDDSPVGKAGHCMRQFFEARWNELCNSHS
nr:bromodomain adjacent to zinc finger domain protein 2B isoform X3 [Onthophagus taurus]